MGKLFCTGDSFIRPWHKKMNPCENPWTVQIARKLDLDIKNTGLAGTSIEWASEQLVSYLHSSEYAESDIIIFVATSPYRAPVVHRNMPVHWQSKLLATLRKELTFANSEQKKYFTKNINTFEFIFNEMLDNKEYNQYRITTIQGMLSSLPNTTFTIDPFGHWKKFMPTNQLSNIINNQNSFFISCKLWQASLNEYKNKNDFNVDNDLRCNHFSDQNHDVLANNILKVLATKDSSSFQIEEFYKEFL